jgi:uncharacterized membrane protein
MRRNVLRLLAGLVIVLVLAAVVGVVAYHFGSNVAGAPVMRGMPGRGFVDGRGVDWAGLGLLGLVGCVLVGVFVFSLLAAFLSPDRGGPRSTGSATGDLERLRELSAMHAQGLLTDEEFSAAKRKLLGLQ